MPTLIAVVHILGAVIVLFAFGFVTLLLSSWELERNKKAAVQDASISLGIPIAELDDPKHHQRITQFVAERSSSELLRNRLSDLCGFVQIGWGWLSNLIQAGVLLSVIWTSVTDDLKWTHRSRQFFSEFKLCPFPSLQLVGAAP